MATVNSITGADSQQYSPIDAQATYQRVEGSLDNPTGALSSDEFLKLFIETLKNQTIDSTTDIKEIMQYTASMTTVETNNANKDALKSVVDTLKSSSKYTSQYGLLPAIGKLAVTNLNSLQFDGKQSTSFSMFFPKEIESGSLEIKNSIGNTIRNIPLDEYVNRYGIQGKDDVGADIKGFKGLANFSWDGTLPDGSISDAGEYSAQINYRDASGKQRSVSLGEYEVLSVKFQNGTPYLNVGDHDVAFSDVLELKGIE